MQNNVTNITNTVDEEILSLLTIEKRSFFLSAGAGSGKTRSLVKALEGLRDKYGVSYSQNSQKIAVITYTNAAKDEIVRRLHFSSVIDVSTIHSFSWKLIETYTEDIKTYLRSYLQEKKEGLIVEQSKGRLGTKTYSARKEKIEKTQERIDKLHEIKKFIYDPMGENLENNALQHQEVIDISSNFISSKQTLRKIIIKKYPYLLIDECQDTNKLLIEALLTLENEFHPDFLVGLFGDMMQRIYPDGKQNLDKALPNHWKTLTKNTNYRSSKRIIGLINKIRNAVDNHEQNPKEGSVEGHVRFFIASQNSDRKRIENQARKIMSEVTDKNEWSRTDSKIKVLILEHHLASVRDEFENLFRSLNEVSSFKQASIDGTLPFLVMLKNRIVPLFEAIKNDNQFAIANTIQKNSELLRKEEPKMFYGLANNIVSNLIQICKSESVRLYDFLKPLSDNNIFEVSEDIKFVLSGKNIEAEDLGTEELNGIKNALKCDMNEAKRYVNYFDKLSAFDTHQGVKGLEYENVLVVLDDQQARGFMFSYDKLFGIKEKSDKDRENEMNNEDTAIDRTRRLFYVTCSRAIDSLAIVAYTQDTDKLNSNLQKSGWFSNSEIYIF